MHIVGIYGVLCFNTTDYGFTGLTTRLTTRLATQLTTTQLTRQLTRQLTTQHKHKPRGSSRRYGRGNRKKDAHLRHRHSRLTAAAGCWYQHAAAAPRGSAHRAQVVRRSVRRRGRWGSLSSSTPGCSRYRSGESPRLHGQKMKSATVEVAVSRAQRTDCRPVARLLRLEVVGRPEPPSAP